MIDSGPSGGSHSPSPTAWSRPTRPNQTQRRRPLDRSLPLGTTWNLPECIDRALDTGRHNTARSYPMSTTPPRPASQPQPPPFPFPFPFPQRPARSGARPKPLLVGAAVEVAMASGCVAGRVSRPVAGGVAGRAADAQPLAHPARPPALRGGDRPCPAAAHHRGSRSPQPGRSKQPTAGCLPHASRVASHRRREAVQSGRNGELARRHGNRCPLRPQTPNTRQGRTRFAVLR